MVRKKRDKSSKLKNSLTYVIRKLFEKNPTSVLSHKQVCTLIDVRETALRKLVYDILQELVIQQFLSTHGSGQFSLLSSNKNIEGFIELTNRGAGFVVSDDEEDDIYVAPQHIGQALNGDRVRVHILKQGKSRIEGKVVEILSRERTQFVGTIELHKNFAFLVPDNLKAGTDIYISKEHLNGAKEGDKALVKITVWPKSSKNPYGEVVEVIGKPGTNDAEMISILANHGIDYKFPESVLNEAEIVSIDIDQEEISNRRDFRSVTTFTIDPIDARDFDDALSIQKLENGHFEIGVHIADVSHYVRPGSAMDAVALKRSNSVYLVDRVVPMLPEQLSNLVCSLRPNEDKFTFSAIFEMDLYGKIYNHWFGKTIIHSDRRFSYEEAQQIIEGGVGEFSDEILTLDKLAKIARAKRLKDGALNIESEEMRFKLDEKGHPVEVVIKTSKDAHKLIEEFMLLANKYVAMFIARRGKGHDQIPFVYRVHDKPDPSKIALFSVFIEKFGHKPDFSNPAKISQKINKLLDDIRLKNEYSLIQSMAIRSMAKASYDTVNIGHYGLAFDFYTHFTSPIRRYADLVVHRILFQELKGIKHAFDSELQEVCKRISRMERKAVEAERESTKYFQTLYVQDHVGEEFDGTISGIAEFGLFVKIDSNQCEGLVPMNAIPKDRYYFDAENYRIIGTRHKKEYNFGDRVRIKIQDVHPRKRQIDMTLVIREE